VITSVNTQTVTDVLSALGEEFVVDIPADHSDGYKIKYDELVTFLTNPPQDFVDRLTGYINTRD